VSANRQAEVASTELFEDVRAVLDAVPTLVDADRTSGEDADPYVVALARKKINEGLTVVVITEDRNDEAGKTCIQSACGQLLIPAMRMRTYLRGLGIAT
jgi:hypothetical protein